jgi:hypothetical protein
MEIPWLSTIDCVVHRIDLFSNILPSSVCQITLQLKDLHQGYVNESNATQEISDPSCQSNVSLTIDHWISSTIVSLLHEKMNSASSQIEALN